MKNQLVYCGIGSRKTPADVLGIMEEIAQTLAKRGWKLRSGHADNADSAFEQGCVKAKGDMEIFLPWSGYNKAVHDGQTYFTTQMLPVHIRASEMAQALHPNWQALTLGGRLLMARNAYQILGRNLLPEEKSDCVICWTPGGKRSGGTGQALRMAEQHGIPIFDLALNDAIDRLEQFIYDMEIMNQGEKQDA